MASNKLFLFALAALVVTAGCLGGPATPAAPVNDDDEMATGGGEADGLGDGLDLTDPETTLRDAGSFTATWRYTGTDENGIETEVSYVYAANLVDERARVTFASADTDDTAGGSWETFTADGVTHTRFASEGAAFYQRHDDGRDVLSEATSHAGIYGYDDAHADAGELVRAGTETYDGVEVTRYELSGTDAWWAAGTAGADGEFTVTDFSYVVLVDGDGLSRYESWSFTGRTADGDAVRGAWEYTLTGVGTTAVEDPEWLAEAERQTR